MGGLKSVAVFWELIFYYVDGGDGARYMDALIIRRFAVLDLIFRCLESVWLKGCRLENGGRPRGGRGSEGEFSFSLGRRIGNSAFVETDQKWMLRYET